MWEQVCQIAPAEVVLLNDRIFFSSKTPLINGLEMTDSVPLNFNETQLLLLLFLDWHGKPVLSKAFRFQASDFYF
jgi:hypothetical protein